MENNNNQDKKFDPAYIQNMQFLQQAKEETEFERIVKILTIPARSGVYISRFDIRDMGRVLGVDIPIKDRKYMMKDLFQYAKQFNQLKEFIDVLIKFVDNKVEEYKSLQEAYPKASELFNTWIDKATKLKNYLNHLKKEIDIYDR
jgi:hypothetical protein